MTIETKQKDSLWQNADFLKFWLGETISVFGTQITRIALPLMAVLLLNVSPVEMGLISFAQLLPSFLLYLFAGVWVDRLPRLLANLGQAIILGLIPLLGWLNLLSVGYLCVVGFLSGCLAVIFGVAYQAYLPSLVGREQLTEGYSKLETSTSIAWIVMPGLVGVIIQIISAPFLILLDAISYLFSAFFTASIKTPEKIEPSSIKRNMWLEIGEGLKFMFSNPTLQALMGCNATVNFTLAWIRAVSILFMVQELKLSASEIGLIFSASGIGALVGTVLSNKIGKMFGVGKTLIIPTLFSGLIGLVLPLISGASWLVVVVLMACEVINLIFVAIYQINQVGVRQTIVPNRLQGRAAATNRFIAIGIAPLGALIGGFLGAFISLRLVNLSAVLWLIFSPIRTMTELPQTTE